MECARVVSKSQPTSIYKPHSKTSRFEKLGALAAGAPDAALRPVVVSGGPAASRPSFSKWLVLWCGL